MVAVHSGKGPIPRLSFSVEKISELPFTLKLEVSQSKNRESLKYLKFLDFCTLETGGSIMVETLRCSTRIGSEAGLLNKRLMLSSRFRCDLIYMYEIYDFGHTLLCYLSWT